MKRGRGHGRRTCVEPLRPGNRRKKIGSAAGVTERERRRKAASGWGAKQRIRSIRRRSSIRCGLVDMHGARPIRVTISCALNQPSCCHRSIRAGNIYSRSRSIDLIIRITYLCNIHILILPMKPSY
jgi:hypothetical protein